MAHIRQVTVQPVLFYGIPSLVLIKSDFQAMDQTQSCLLKGAQGLRSFFGPLKVNKISD